MRCVHIFWFSKHGHLFSLMPYSLFHPQYPDLSPQLQAPMPIAGTSSSVTCLKAQATLCRYIMLL